MNQKQFQVYWLINNLTGEPFYVGSTTQIPHYRRRREHNFHARSGIGNMLKNQIIKSIDFNYTMEIVEEVKNETESLALESYWANQLKAWGFPICNSHYIKPAKKYIRSLSLKSIPIHVELWNELKYSEVVELGNKTGLPFVSIRRAFLNNRFPVALYDAMTEKKQQSA